MTQDEHEKQLQKAAIIFGGWMALKMRAFKKSIENMSTTTTEYDIDKLKELLDETETNDELV